VADHPLPVFFQGAGATVGDRRATRFRWGGVLWLNHSSNTITLRAKGRKKSRIEMISSHIPDCEGFLRSWGISR